MPDFDERKKLADDHDSQVDQGLEKAGDAASDKVGHRDEVDKGVDFAQQHTGAGDTDQN
jgi:hypothetical protein